MRTTIRMDDDLLEAVKHEAASRGVTITAVIEEAVRGMFAKRAGNAARPRVQLHTIGGPGLQPGVDLDDSAALLDLMERG